MARPKTPTNVLEMRGAFKKHPERKRKAEPKPTGTVPGAPEWFDDEQRAAYALILSQAVAGVLTNADGALVIQAAKLFAKMKLDTATTGDMVLLNRCLSQMGMTPADRSRVSVPQSDERPKEDPWAGFGA